MAAAKAINSAPSWHAVEVSPAKSPDAGGAGQVHLPEKISEKPLTTSGVSGIIESKLPVKDAQLKHMFGNRKGHLPDTPENRRTIEGVANFFIKYLPSSPDSSPNHSDRKKLSSFSFRLKTESLLV